MAVYMISLYFYMWNRFGYRLNLEWSEKTSSIERFFSKTKKLFENEDDWIFSVSELIVFETAVFSWESCGHSKTSFFILQYPLSFTKTLWWNIRGKGFQDYYGAFGDINILTYFHVLWEKEKPGFKCIL